MNVYVIKPIHFIVFINCVYDLLCALSILFKSDISPLTNLHTSIFYSQLHSPILHRFIAYYILINGFIRISILFNNYIAIYLAFLSYLIEAMVFYLELFVFNSVKHFQVIWIVLSSLYLAVFLLFLS